MTLEDVIAQKTLALQAKPLSGETLHLLKRHLLDSYAGICASLQDAPMIGNFRRYAAFFPDEAGVTVWGTGRKAQLVHAVFMNAILGRRSDLVNTYLSPDHMGGNHPSDNVSLLLTLSQWRGLGGGDFLRAMHLAYVLSCAFSDYYDPEGGGFDHDAASGLYTALITGSVLGLSQKELAEAQRMAGAMGLNPNQAGVGVITDWKHCTYASCAMRGVSAAVMARAGFHGPVDIYGGEAGVDRFLPHAASFMDQPPDLARIVFKRWQALVFCQTAIDAALMLHPAFAGLDLSRVTKVEVSNYHMAMVQAGTPDSARPVSRAGRTHSLPYCVAAALIWGTIDYGSFSDETAGSKDLQALMSKIVLFDDPAMTAVYPEKSPCRIVVGVEGRAPLEAGLDYPKGDPRAPLEDGEIEAKAQAYLANLTDQETAGDVIRRIWALENERGLDWLLAPLQREARHAAKAPQDG